MDLNREDVPYSRGFGEKDMLLKTHKMAIKFTQQGSWNIYTLSALWDGKMFSGRYRPLDNLVHAILGFKDAAQATGR